MTQDGRREEIEVPQRYADFLQQKLTPPRLQHSLGVMQVMQELTPIYALDPTRARLAGLLHDAARELPAERLLALAHEAGIPIEHEADTHPIYLHGPVGAHIVSTALYVDDPIILNAIAAHTDWHDDGADEATLVMCLRCSDILAPVRPWLGMKKLGEFVYAGRIQEATLLRRGWLIEYFEEGQIPVHPNLRKQFLAHMAEWNVEPDFFERW